VEDVALIRRVFLGLFAKMIDRYLEQRINVKFCGKLTGNASDICEIPSEAYGGEAMKNSKVSERHKRFKVGCENVIDDDDNAHHFLRYQGYCSL
jgi:hypothetical protein